MTNPQAVEALPEELAERERFKAWAIEAGLMTAPDESGLCFKSDACRPAWAAWLMRSTLPAPQPEAQALPDSPSLRSAARAVVAVRKRHGWSPEADAAIHALEAALSSPAPAPLTPLLFSRRLAIARKFGVPFDAAFNAIVREVELQHGIGSKTGGA